MASQPISYYKLNQKLLKDPWTTHLKISLYPVHFSIFQVLLIKNVEYCDSSKTS